MSSLYHSKSGVGTADASHRSKACRPVAASLLLDSVMVGGSAGTKHMVTSHTSRWNDTVKLSGLVSSCKPFGSVEAHDSFWLWHMLSPAPLENNTCSLNSP